MAVLPDVQSIRRTARPTRGIATISPGAAAAPGDALQGVAAEAARFGEVLFDREATAMATERDNLLSDQIRDLIYNPETGFGSLQGKQAVDAREDMIAKLKALQSTAYDGLNGTAKRKLSPSLNRRISGAIGTVERHTLGQRDAWLAGASEARIKAAYQDSLFNPADTASALAVIENETRAQGNREGWGAERTQGELDARRSKMFADQVGRIAAADPIAAMEYMRQNQDRMVASDIVNIETRLQPEIKKAIGREKGAAAANGMPSYDHNTSISYGLGLKRPFAPDRPVLDVIGRSVEDVLGPGAKVVVTSGQEGPNAQYGSNRHKTGNAADVQIIRPDGTVVKATDSEMTSIALAAASLGAKGIGFGNEYMGGEHIHIDLVDPGKDQKNTWASGGTSIRDAVVGLIGDRDSSGGLNDIINEADPVQRAAALAEYDLITSARAGQQKAALAAAQDSAFQMIEAGGSLDTLPLDVRQALGQGAMTSLRSYQSTLARGETVRTDSSTYYELRQMQARNPAGFLALNLLEYRDKLDDGDWQKMVDAQTKPADSIATSAASTIMAMASRQLKSAGINPNADPGSRDTATAATLQTSLLKWQDNFVSENKRRPTQTEIDERISRELLPLVIDAPGFTGDSDNQDALLIQLKAMNLSKSKLADTSITMFGTEVPPEVINAEIDMMSADGIPVTAYNLVSRLADLFASAGIE